VDVLRADAGADRTIHPAGTPARNAVPHVVAEVVGSRCDLVTGGCCAGFPNTAFPTWSIRLACPDARSGRCSARLMSVHYRLNTRLLVRQRWTGKRAPVEFLKGRFARQGLRDGRPCGGGSLAPGFAPDPRSARGKLTLRSAPASLARRRTSAEWSRGLRSR
jgi:hypothetical protein